MNDLTVIPCTYEEYLEQLAIEQKYDEDNRLLRQEQKDAESKIFTYDENFSFQTREEAYKDFLEEQDYVDPDTSPTKIFSNYEQAVTFMNGYFIHPELYQPVLSEGKHDIYTLFNENESMLVILKEDLSIQYIDMIRDYKLDMYVTENEFNDHIKWLSK